MQRKHLIAASAALALARVLPAQAASSEIDGPDMGTATSVFSSTRTRAEVQAELYAVRSSGRLEQGGEASTPDSVIAAREFYAQIQTVAIYAGFEIERQIAQETADAAMALADAPALATPGALAQAPAGDVVQPVVMVVHLDSSGQVLVVETIDID